MIAKLNYNEQKTLRFVFTSGVHHKEDFVIQYLFEKFNYKTNKCSKLFYNHLQNV